MVYCQTHTQSSSLCGCTHSTQFLHCHTNVTLHYGFQYKKSHVMEIITGLIIYSETWVCVKTHIKFRQSPVKSRSVSNAEHSMKSGGVRCELNLCVGSPVTEAYGKLDDVLELSRSYVRDGQRLCVKHREFFQSDNRKKARNWYLSWFPDWSYFPVLVRCIYTN